MAVIDPLKRPPAVDPLRPISVVRGLPVQAPAGTAPVSVPRALGQGARTAVGLADQSSKLVGIPAAGIANALSSAGAEFMTGLTGKAQTPKQYEGVSFSELFGGGPAAPSRLSSNSLPASVQDAAQGLRLAARTAPTSQTAPTSTVSPRNLPAGPAVFSTGNAGFGTAQLGSGAPQRIASNYGAGITNVVPSYVPPSAYAPQAARQTTAQRPRGAESAALARSREMDAMLRQLVQRVQQEPQSYGELFARKGTLAALGQLGDLSQAAGTNYIQGAGDVLQADTSRYSTDRGFESNLGAQAVQARGDDLQFESNLGQQDVTWKTGLLQRMLEADKLAADERNSVRQAEAVGGAGAARAAAIQESGRMRAQATSDAAKTMADMQQQVAAMKYPEAALRTAFSTQNNLKGKPATAEEMAIMKEMLQALQSPY